MTPKTPKKHKQRFEHEWHKTELEDITLRLREYQKDGWELVTVVGSLPSENYTLFFKRPV